jgi:effector-binding domain-containing protein
MNYDVVVETAQPESVAAVRATVAIRGIAQAWKPALDQVWAFLKTNVELGPGHNLFLYHHPEHRNEAMNIDFGVQVARPFEQEGNVRCIETPAGEVARTVHVGPYDRLGDAHNAIHAWCATNNGKIVGASWEIY